MLNHKGEKYTKTEGYFNIVGLAEAKAGHLMKEGHNTLIARRSGRYPSYLLYKSKSKYNKKDVKMSFKGKKPKYRKKSSYSLKEFKKLKNKFD